jgi:hypothetical protein
MQLFYSLLRTSVKDITIILTHPLENLKTKCSFGNNNCSVFGPVAQPPLSLCYRTG